MHSSVLFIQNTKSRFFLFFPPFIYPSCKERHLRFFFQQNVLKTSISGHEAVIKYYSILFLDLVLDAHQRTKFSPLLSKLKPFFPLLLPSYQHKGNTCLTHYFDSLIFPERYIVYKIKYTKICYFNIYIINMC